MIVDKIESLHYIHLPGEVESAKMIPFYIFLTAVLYLVAVWHLLIAILALFPRFRGTAIGTLEKTRTERNVERWARGRGTYIVPIITYYRYSYKVGKREYTYSREGYFSKKQLFPKTSMVYVKGFPRHAYPNKFKGTNEWWIGGGALFMAVLLTILLACGAT